MKIIAIGDIHGRSDWRKIIDQNLDADKIVFVGDYFDTHEATTPEEQFYNFLALVECKKNLGDKMVMLIGNHDYHYLGVFGEQYSGYDRMNAHKFWDELWKAIEKGYLQMAYQNGEFLFTHAGVTRTWAKKYEIDSKEPADSINKLFAMNKEAFKFNREDKMGYGEHIGQSPIWVRPKSLHEDRFEDFVHVVGHTTQKNGVSLEGKVILIDTLGATGDYLEISDNSGVTRVITRKSRYEHE